ncbi:MAG: magnesium chelatase subunit H [Azospirillum sp.]|nr:magnesium chelatase subunit H [Azospirillum sp.]
MPKRTSPADATPIRVVLVTMDSHLTGAAMAAGAALRKELPGLEIAVHAADRWGSDAERLAQCKADIARANIVVATMLFLDEHIRAVFDDLKARRDDCDAIVCCMSAGEVVKLTRMGRFNMSAEALGVIGWLKRLRGAKSGSGESSGERQMRMLRRLPKFLRFVPGTAQDLRAYFLALQYWLAGSRENFANLIRMLVERYADGARKGLRAAVKAAPPVDYPDVGVYHPAMPGRIAETAGKLPAGPADPAGTVGVLVMRSYLLAGNAAHYDGAIAAIEAAGLRAVPVFAAGLDARPAIEKFFLRDGRPCVDAVVSLTGFSLVGGPAYNDSRAAEDVLAKLDVPYVSAHPLEFQTLEEWGASARGLMPVESTIMVALPELDGAGAPQVFGGRSSGAGQPCTGCAERCVFPERGGGLDMRVCKERAGALAARVRKLVELRRARAADRKVAVVLFNFPPNAGNAGTAAHLSVFESLHRTMKAMAREGYAIDVPASAEALRKRLLEGNAARFGTIANVHARVAADDHVRRETWLGEIEAVWGPAPGKHLTDGGALFVLGERFGNMFVGLQPGFGFEGDPMRLMFEKGRAPTHAFSAFYRWIREDFGAAALLHFGTHGALEFMPGKQTGMSGACWPSRLAGDLPHVYLYAANNPSEGTIAKRRSGATLVTYLTPPLAHAGLYRELSALRASIDRWRGLPPENANERADLAGMIQAQAATIDLADAEPQWPAGGEAEIPALASKLAEVESTLIPQGLHVFGSPPDADKRIETLAVLAGASPGGPSRAAIEALVHGERVPEGDWAPERFAEIARIDRLLADNREMDGLLKALAGRYVRPVAGGDLLSNPDILPTGRNMHGFDPFRIPSAFALSRGARQARKLLERHVAETGATPESVAIVLWGTDNLKSEGGPIAQALALMGAAPRFDSYGRLAGARLLPLAELPGPRIDVVMTLSGIFRDLLPLQSKLLAEAAWLAASADEPEDRNFVRKHALAYARETGCDLAAAALRVFGNAEGAYGANVNMLVDNGAWQDADELGETFVRRKSFAYAPDGRTVASPALMTRALADVGAAFQNLDSVELGITTISHYFDTLGGISKAAERARGGAAPAVYIGDQTRGEGTVRTLGEQVALEARTRILNPAWYESMLEHGYEGARQLDEHITNAMGWSATTGKVPAWVYRRVTETFVLDRAMRDRLAALNPAASAKLASRLLEAEQRRYWQADSETLDALRRAGDELEEKLEGVTGGVAA